MTRRRWIALAALAACALVTGYCAWRYGTRYCAALKTANLLKEAKDRVPLDCGEFWLNRYQTAYVGVLSVVAALGAARFAWLGIMKQMTLQRRSNQIAELGLQRSRLLEARARLHSLNAAQRKIAVIDEAAKQYPVGQNVEIAMITALANQGEFPFAPVANAFGPAGAIIDHYNEWTASLNQAWLNSRRGNLDEITQLARQLRPRIDMLRGLRSLTDTLVNISIAEIGSADEHIHLIEGELGLVERHATRT
jgi:hypothetical protein